jgi:hypothetical protein
MILESESDPATVPPESLALEPPIEGVERRRWPRDPRYFATRQGQIYGPAGRPLRAVTNRGRLYVNRRVPGGNSLAQVSVIVCETFHGPRPPGMHAAHEDGNPQNNAADNLSWKTPAENEADKKRHGTYQWGSNNPCAKLTEDMVRSFRERHANGETMVSIARDFGVSRTTLGAIKSGKNWGHLQ